MSSCAGCGTALDVQKEKRMQSGSTQKNGPSILNAKTATCILLLYFATEAICDILAGLTGLSEITGLVLSSVLGGGVMIFASIVLLQKQLKDIGPTGSAWVGGRLNAIMIGLIIGFAIGFSEHVLTLIAKPHIPYQDLSTLQRMVLIPGLQQWICIIVVLLGSPVEEMLFRGVIYGGYRKTFGPMWAAISTTLIFVAIHVPYYSHFAPAVIVYIALALSALWCRLRWNAIGPAAALHIGYNLMVAFWIVYRTSHR